METDKRYFIEGLFIIGLGLAAALAFVWIAGGGHRDDMLYRIRFDESVTGLSQGDPVKFRGVDVGNVKRMSIAPDDPRLVQVDVLLHKDAPVRTDTRATLKLKGLTGVVYIELTGASPDAASLAAATPPGQIPQIPSEKSTLSNALEQLPKAIENFSALEAKLSPVIQKFSGLENQTKKVLSDVGEVTNKVKENPSLLLRAPKKEKPSDTSPHDTAGR
jgi:phospholipid/cholesterol/gamma-HCH transport system substrate-binding protein